MPTLNENIAQVKADFGGIKRELVNKGASIPSGTPTSQYANIIKNMSTGGSEEAYEQGRQDVIAESKYIPKSAVGKFISLTDVSEVSHKVKVIGVGNEVDVYGKNLFDISTDIRFIQQEDGSYITNERVPNIEIPYALPYGTYTLSYDMSCAVGRNARIKIYLKDGTSVEDYKVSTGEFLHFEKVITGEIVGWGIYYSTTPQAGELIIKNAQIEVGSIATPYEPYTHQTIIATPVGTEIPSLCPNMTFIADEEIKVDYYSSFGMAEKELAMWNALTNFGARRNYDYAFCEADFSGYSIPEGLCKPTQRIGAMFYNYKGTEFPKGVDCSDFIVTDTTKNNHCVNTFAYAQKVKHIPDMRIPANLHYQATYNSCTLLESIEIVRSDENTQFYVNTFQSDTKLTHVIFSGTIASDINLQWSKLLDEESLQSLTQSLADFIMLGNNPDGTNIPEGQPFTKTITLSPESWAILDNLEFIPPEGTGYPTGFSCTTIITTAKGWNKA